MRMNFIIIIISIVYICQASGVEYAVTCKDYSKFYITFDFGSKNQAFIAINPEQIHVIAKVVKKRDVIDFFLMGPCDLGERGLKLSWKDFSKTKSILTLKKEKGQKKYIANWHGFYDTGIKKYIWVKNSSLVKNKYYKLYYLYECE